MYTSLNNFQVSHAQCYQPSTMAISPGKPVQQYPVTMVMYAHWNVTKSTSYQTVGRKWSIHVRLIKHGCLSRELSHAKVEMARKHDEVPNMDGLYQQNAVWHRNIK